MKMPFFSPPLSGALRAFGLLALLLAAQTSAAQCPTIGLTRDSAQPVVFGCENFVDEIFSANIDNCLTDTYSDPNSQPHPDVWFQFSLAAPTEINITACYSASPNGSSSGLHYRIHLLDALPVHPFYQHKQTALGTGPSNCNGYAGVSPVLNAQVPAGTYYVVVEVEKLANPLPEAQILLSIEKLNFSTTPQLQIYRVHFKTANALNSPSS
jgi:hypothetical protein